MIRRALKRLFDVVGATLGLVVAAPVLVLAALGIRLASPGPVLYLARRLGVGGRPFTMYKLRTMRLNGTAPGSRITGVDDPRVFPLGRLLRHTKIDELPQLVNVLKGDMSIIGPRPEDPDLVARHYTPADRETLTVRPGLASPGSLYHDTHGLHVLAGPDPEMRYVERLLPLKLALDLVYVRRTSVRYDLALVGRTVAVILGKLLGRRAFPNPPELAAARRLMARAEPPAARRFPAAMLLVAVVAAAAGCREIGPGPGPDPEPNPVTGDSTAILVGAGDLAHCAWTGDEATADLLDSIPGTVFTTGDNAYPDGSATDYANCYEPNWGRHRERTRPVPGNHEYYTPEASGYFDYFGDAAGERGAGYYSYDLGMWHVVALNSEIDMTSSSAQFAWLLADLTENPRRCTLAYWHRPRFSSGTTHGGSSSVQSLWDVLYEAGADVVLAGHEHNYERFAPQTPGGGFDWPYGIRQFVVGTGGNSAHGFGPPVANSEVRETGTEGVLVLRLLPESYEWRFVPVAGQTFADSGAAACHDAPPAGGAGR